jgi:hypothetical protein
VGSELCPQREVEKVGLECGPRGCKGEGAGYPTKPESSDVDEEEGGITPALLSPPCVTLPLFSDIIDRQVGITISIYASRNGNETGTGTGSSIGWPQQPRLMSVSSNSMGMSVVPLLMETTHLPRIS